MREDVHVCESETSVMAMSHGGLETGGWSLGRDRSGEGIQGLQHVAQGTQVRSPGRGHPSSDSGAKNSGGRAGAPGPSWVKPGGRAGSRRRGGGWDRHRQTTCHEEKWVLKRSRAAGGSSWAMGSRPQMVPLLFVKPSRVGCLASSPRGSAPVSLSPAPHQPVPCPWWAPGSRLLKS